MTATSLVSVGRKRSPASRDANACARGISVTVWIDDVAELDGRAEADRGEDLTTLADDWTGATEEDEAVDEILLALDDDCADRVEEDKTLLEEEAEEAGREATSTGYSLICPEPAPLLRKAVALFIACVPFQTT